MFIYVNSDYTDDYILIINALKHLSPIPLESLLGFSVSGSRLVEVLWRNKLVVRRKKSIKCDMIIKSIEMYRSKYFLRLPKTRIKSY